MRDRTYHGKTGQESHLAYLDNEGDGSAKVDGFVLVVASKRGRKVDGLTPRISCAELVG